MFAKFLSKISVHNLCNFIYLEKILFILSNDIRVIDEWTDLILPWNIKTYLRAQENFSTRLQTPGVTPNTTPKMHPDVWERAGKVTGAMNQSCCGRPSFGRKLCPPAVFYSSPSWEALYVRMDYEQGKPGSRRQVLGAYWRCLCCPVRAY